MRGETASRSAILIIPMSLAAVYWVVLGTGVASLVLSILAARGVDGANAVGS
jgi:hypothetical protein